MVQFSELYSSLGCEAAGLGWNSGPGLCPRVSHVKHFDPIPPLAAPPTVGSLSPPRPRTVPPPCPGPGFHPHNTSPRRHCRRTRLSLHTSCLSVFCECLLHCYPYHIILLGLYILQLWVDNYYPFLYSLVTFCFPPSQLLSPLPNFPLFARMTVLVPIEVDQPPGGRPAPTPTPIGASRFASPPEPGDEVPDLEDVVRRVRGARRIVVVCGESVYGLCVCLICR